MSDVMMKKRVQLTIGDKMKILADVDGKVDRKTICHKFRCDKSTVSKIISNRSQIISAAKYSAKSRKRQRSNHFPELDSLLTNWVAMQQHLKVQINGPSLQKMANQFANALKLEPKTGEITSSWIDRFKERHGITFKITELSSMTELNSQETDTHVTAEASGGAKTSYSTTCNYNDGSLKPKIEVPEYEGCELVTVSDSGSSPEDASKESEDAADMPYIPCKVEIITEEEDEQPVAKVPPDNESVLCVRCRNRVTKEVSTQTEAATA